MLGRLHLGYEEAEGEDDVPDRDGHEAALEAWHASADRDGIDVPLMPDEEVVEVGERADQYVAGSAGDGPAGEDYDGRDETGAADDGVQSPE
jgi:hypothetical protein